VVAFDKERRCYMQVCDSGRGGLCVMGLAHLHLTACMCRLLDVGQGLGYVMECDSARMCVFYCVCSHLAEEWHR
jgi:hypothetical protein